MWKGVDIVIDLLTHVMQLLRKADAEEPCPSFTYNAMESLVHEVERLELHHAPLQCMKRREEVMAIVQPRWTFLHQPVYSAAHALNPAFMREELTATVVDELDEILLLFQEGLWRSLT
jgi:hypothetical protein